MRTNKSIFILLALTILSSASFSQSPSSYWNLDKITDRTCLDQIAGIADTIEGNTFEAKGVLGQGIRLDGFTSRIKSNGKNIEFNKYNDGSIEFSTAKGTAYVLQIIK